MSVLMLKHLFSRRQRCCNNWLSILCTLLALSVGGGEGQRIGAAEGERLKARLLANLNKYSAGQGSRSAEGPMEALGAWREITTTTSSTMLPTTSIAFADPIASLLALFRPPAPPAAPPPPFPLLIPWASTTAQTTTLTANFQQIVPQESPLSTERHEHQQRQLPSSASGDQQTNRHTQKWSRTDAEVIGEWRRRMYKMLKSARRQRSSREDSSKERMKQHSVAAADPLQQRQRRRQQFYAAPFGSRTPSATDARRAHSLAKLFGVENARNGTAAAGRVLTMMPLRRKLHSSELRTKAGRKMAKLISRTTTTTMASIKEAEEGDENDDIYAEIATADDDERAQHDGSSAADQQQQQQDERRLEIVYVPAALKMRRKLLLKSKEATTTTATEEGDTDRQKNEGQKGDQQNGQQKDKQQLSLIEPPNGKMRASSLWLSSASDMAAAAHAPPNPTPPSPRAAAADPAPIVPLLSMPSPSLSPSVPSTLLPLQFPTLLPPIVPPSLAVVPSSASPPRVLQLSDLIAKPALRTSILTAPEGDYLKELENVPEDYVDEQENSLPCLRNRSPSLPGGGRPFVRDGINGPSLTGCQQMQMALAGRRAEQSAAAIRTPSTGIFFEAPAEQQTDGTVQNTLWDENREMCNSARLRALIQKSIVPTNVEKSKRRLQQQAEQQFGTFYNVICGTGFFSYIAHTDEFCLMAVQDMNCYVFSPVCSTQLTSVSSGISRQRKEREAIFTVAKQRHLKALLNRN